jgi:hypothetical protein
MRGHIYAVSPLVETGRFFSFLIQLPDFMIRSQKKLDYLLAVAVEDVTIIGNLEIVAVDEIRYFLR